MHLSDFFSKSAFLSSRSELIKAIHSAPASLFTEILDPEVDLTLAMIIATQNVAYGLMLPRETIIHVFDKSDLHYKTSYGWDLAKMIVDYCRTEKLDLGADKLFEYLNKSNLNNRLPDNKDTFESIAENHASNELGLSSNQLFELFKQYDFKADLPKNRYNHSKDIASTLLQYNTSQELNLSEEQLMFFFKQSLFFYKSPGALQKNLGAEILSKIYRQEFSLSQDNFYTLVNNSDMDLLTKQTYNFTYHMVSKKPFTQSVAKVVKELNVEENLIGIKNLLLSINPNPIKNKTLERLNVFMEASALHSYNEISTPDDTSASITKKAPNRFL